MKKPIFVHLILFSIFLKLFRLGASTVSWSKLFHLSMTRFEKKYFLIFVLNHGLQIFLLWPRKPYHYHQAWIKPLCLSLCNRRTFLAKVIRISCAKFHCNIVQDIQDYANLVFGTQCICAIYAGIDACLTQW